MFEVQALLHDARVPMAFEGNGSFAAMPASFNEPFSARYGLTPSHPEINSEFWAVHEIRDLFSSLQYADFQALDADVYGNAFAAGLVEYDKFYLEGPVWDASGVVSATPWYRIYDGIERLYRAWSSDWVASHQIEHYFNKQLQKTIFR